MPISKQDLDFDANHIWHPYTNLKTPTPVYGVDSANGVLLNLSNGHQVVDGMSSWWSAIHGYNHPVLNNAIKIQIEKMSHVMFGGLTHQPAIDLCKTLVEITAPVLEKVFISDSGSVAVEVALKMALQYWYSLGKPEKNQFLTIKNGYHGDTFGAMSVCDPENGLHSMFSGMLPEQIFVPAFTCSSDEDWKDEYIIEFRKALEASQNSIAAVILEPIAQGAGGMRFYCGEYLRQVRLLCDEHNVLLIFDEIATGFGRTGKLFAYEHASISPDILCVGKALTGGYLSLAATLCSTQIANMISEYENGNLMHGPTFMGNPLACAVANASLDLLLNSDWQQKVQQIETQLNEQLFVCKKLSSVHDVRIKGAIGVVELKKPVDMKQVQARFVELGVWIRPFGKLIYIMPPFIIDSKNLNLLTDAIYTVSKEQI